MHKFLGGRQSEQPVDEPRGEQSPESSVDSGEELLLESLTREREELVREQKQLQDDVRRLEAAARERDGLVRERTRLVEKVRQLEGVERERNELASERAQLQEEVRQLEGVGREQQDQLPEPEELLYERAELLSTVERLEQELASYRKHAQRTSKLFTLSTHYAESMRESARRDAELALRKARTKADETVGDAEKERERAERELARLRALTTETRKRLSAFTAAAIDLLDIGADARPDDGSEPVPEDLPAALRTELTAAVRSTPDALPTGSH